MKPKVSVLTTVYNRASYLGDCIESVQQSKFKDYEHIIVDDGSSDSSVSIAKKYAAEDGRIKLYINEKNLGDYPNRNQAARHATGEYLKYLDADDVHGPWILNIMVDALDQHPEAGFGLIDYDNSTEGRILSLEGAQAQLQFYNKQRNHFNRSPLNAILRKNAFESVGGFSGKRMVGDFELWHMLTTQFNMVLIPPTQLWYRKHADQEMSHHARDPMWGFRYLLVSHEQLNHPQNPIDPGPRQTNLLLIEKKIGRTIILATKKFGLRKANEMRNAIQWSWRRTLQAAFS